MKISELNEERDAAASIAARALGLGATLFKNMPLGARFVFKLEDAARPHCVLIKTHKGYRHEIGGRQWKTGARVACHILGESNASN